MEMKCPVIINKRVEGTKYQKYRARCGADAKLYEVWGDSFCARQELCNLHALKARQEGFRLFEIIDIKEEAENPPAGS